jgi:hypothetical protein
MGIEGAEIGKSVRDDIEMPMLSCCEQEMDVFEYWSDTTNNDFPFDIQFPDS